ncbi:hypothetical protein FS749_002408 [Ceratobasidium sp. UAMH 11750]|nr:hypothetical protein FS749_002408 [Ceratobasidium sp. UAMH 11750]
MHASIARTHLIDGVHYSLDDTNALLETSWACGSTTEGPADLLVGRDGGPAYLTGYFTLDHTNFRLDLVGGYDPDCLPVADLAKGYTQAYSEAFGSALLSPVPSYCTEFSNYCVNLRILMDRAHPKPVKRGLFTDNDGEPNLVLRHRMFQECVGPIDLSDSEDDVLFRMVNWPVPASCKDIHRAITYTHKPSPIPVFVVGSNNLIHPSEYVSQLHGSVVRVDFSLIHKVVGQEVPASLFLALINCILVLENDVLAGFL